MSEMEHRRMVEKIRKFVISNSQELFDSTGICGIEIDTKCAPMTVSIKISGNVWGETIDKLMGGFKSTFGGTWQIYIDNGSAVLQLRIKEDYEVEE